MAEALRSHADPEIQEWVRTKGEADGMRHLHLIWGKIEQAANQPDPIDELNKTFAVIRVENRVAILNEHLDAEKRPTFSLLSLDSFKLLLANRKLETPSTDAMVMKSLQRSRGQDIGSPIPGADSTKE